MNKAKFFTCALTGVLLVGLSQSVLSHTRLNVAKAAEGNRNINQMVISHSCNETSSTFGTSVVFPDGVDSTILVDDVAHEGTILDFLTNYGNNHQLILDRASFDKMEEKIVNGNVVGYWAGGGPGMINSMNAITSIRHTAAGIEPTSCAAEVQIKISVADICQVTSTSDFTDDVVNLWTHNDLGTPYDRVSETDDGPATFTITRDLVTNPLPEDCGETGAIVVVKPSAAQINRDMPIMWNGSQVWPLP
jgi:hypothetical protein